MRNSDGFFLTAKGGNNGESHNHNDVGSFILYVDTIPFFIDLGVGTYTKQTFSADRFKIWTVQSNYHNLPIVNGFTQKDSIQYKASNVQYDAVKMQFSMDIVGTYGDAVKARYWNRKFQLTETQLVIKDDFLLIKAVAPNKEVFMTWAKPEIVKPGWIRLSKEKTRLVFKYDSKIFRPEVESIKLEDKRLSNIWGDYVYRLVLTTKEKKIKGDYTFTVSKEEK